MKWYKPEERLPAHKQRTIIKINKTYPKWYDPTPEKYHGATFYHGCDPRPGDTVQAHDKQGKNERPYAWYTGPVLWYGQEVECWAEIEEPPA